MSVDRTEEVESSDEETVAAKAAVSATATAAQTYYPVAPGVNLNVRSGPGTGYRIVRVLPKGAFVPIFCQKPGSRSAAHTARRTSGTTSASASTSRTPM